MQRIASARPMTTKFAVRVAANVCATPESRYRVASVLAGMIGSPLWGRLVGMIAPIR